jgi:DNA-binding transcriptional ArsR family regulator
MQPLLLAILVVTSLVPEPVTVYSIHLLDDGSSRWIVEQRFPLGPAESEIPENLSETLSIRAAEYQERLSAIVEDASRSLGREMSLENVSVEARVLETISGRMGVIRLSFIWRGFAKVSQPGVVVVGDVFLGGLYLAEGESLRIYLPEGYSVVDARPRPDDFGEHYVGWDGRRIFADGEPRIVASRQTPAAGAEGQSTWIDLWLLAILTAAAVTAAVLVIYTIRRRTRHSVRRRDVETILEFLRRNGGRAYQSQIVRGCGLPKSTVSMLLKVLEAEGRVVRERMGRENLVRLVD